MKYTEKKALYESIMKEVGRTVKKRLNESSNQPQLVSTKNTKMTCDRMNIEKFVSTIKDIMIDKTGNYYFRYYDKKNALIVGKRFSEFAKTIPYTNEDRPYIVNYWMTLAAAFYDQLNIMIDEGYYMPDLVNGMLDADIETVARRAVNAIIEADRKQMSRKPLPHYAPPKSRLVNDEDGVEEDMMTVVEWIKAR